MQEDFSGAYYPVIDEDKCTRCNRCVRVCPNNSKVGFSYPESCFASWITDERKRLICASGGIATIMSEFVIKNGGVVFGSRYDERMIPIISFTDEIKELDKYKGSRYVQSIVGQGTFESVQGFLKSGRKVLYVGTPCQIAGLTNFLGRDFDNLITIDLICHGVSPTKYFNEEIEHIKMKLRLGKITDIRFRGNDKYDFCLSIWDNKKLLYSGSGCRQYYLAGFLLGVTLRENCRTCNYARPERIADITIGDFIGLGRKVRFNSSKRNVSSVFINTEKGRIFYISMSDQNQDLMNVKREFEERLEYKPSLCYPFPRHELSDAFIENYRTYGYVAGIRKTLYKSVLKADIMYYIGFYTYIYRIPRKIFRLIMALVLKK